MSVSKQLSKLVISALEALIHTHAHATHKCKICIWWDKEDLAEDSKGSWSWINECYVPNSDLRKYSWENTKILCKHLCENQLLCLFSVFELLLLMLLLLPNINSGHIFAENEITKTNTRYHSLYSFGSCWKWFFDSTDRLLAALHI